MDKIHKINKETHRCYNTFTTSSSFKTVLEDLVECNPCNSKDQTKISFKVSSISTNNQTSSSNRTHNRINSFRHFQCRWDKVATNSWASQIHNSSHKECILNKVVSSNFSSQDRVKLVNSLHRTSSSIKELVEAKNSILDRLVTNLTNKDSSSRAKETSTDSWVLTTSNRWVFNLSSASNQQDPTQVCKCRCSS